MTRSGALPRFDMEHHLQSLREVPWELSRRSPRCPPQARSLADAHSSFTYDAARMTRMLKYSTGRSLLLVDEFGKGTASVDGAALLSASLGYLARRGQAAAPTAAAGAADRASLDESPQGAAACPALSKLQVPRAMVITHFREALDFGQRDALAADGSVATLSSGGPETSQSACLLHMRVVIDGQLGGDELRPAEGPPTKIRPLFQLATGAGEGSFGLACAAASGLPDRVVQRAADVMRRLKAGKSILPVAPQGHAMAAVLRRVAEQDHLPATSTSSGESLHGIQAALGACFGYRCE